MTDKSNFTPDRSGQELPAAGIPSIMMKEGRPASGWIKICPDA